MAGPTGWTNERVETLKQLWAEGFSAVQVAERIGTTRNAVIGKVYRLGLCKRMDPRAATSSQRNARKKRAKALSSQRNARKKRAKAFAARKQRRSASVFVVEALPLPREDAPAGPLVMFADLEAHHCRAPYGDPKQPGFGFCGCKVIPGLSYCETHVRRFYTARNPVVRPDVAARNLRNLARRFGRPVSVTVEEREDVLA